MRSPSARALMKSGAALRAAAVQDDLVAGQLESAGDKLPEAGQTHSRLEDPPVVVALEMVVVPLSRQLEARGLTGQSDRDDAPLFDQRLDGAIHGRDTEALLVRPRAAEDFADRHGTAGAVEHVVNRLELSGLSDARRHNRSIIAQAGALGTVLRMAYHLRSAHECFLGSGHHRHGRRVEWRAHRRAPPGGGQPPHAPARLSGIALLWPGGGPRHPAREQGGAQLADLPLGRRRRLRRVLADWEVRRADLSRVRDENLRNRPPPFARDRPDLPDSRPEHPLLLRRTRRERRVDGRGLVRPPRVRRDRRPQAPRGLCAGVEAEGGGPHALGGVRAGGGGRGLHARGRAGRLRMGPSLRALALAGAREYRRHVSLSGYQRSLGSAVARTAGCRRPLLMTRTIARKDCAEIPP